MKRILVSSFSLKMDAFRIAIMAPGDQSFALPHSASKPPYISGFARVFSRLACDHPLQGSSFSTLLAQVWFLKIHQKLWFFVMYYLFRRPTIKHQLAWHHPEWLIPAVCSASLRVISVHLLGFHFRPLSCIRSSLSFILVRVM